VVLGLHLGKSNRTVIYPKRSMACSACPCCSLVLQQLLCSHNRTKGRSVWLTEGNEMERRSTDTKRTSGRNTRHQRLRKPTSEQTSERAERSPREVFLKEDTAQLLPDFGTTPLAPSAEPRASEKLWLHHSGCLFSDDLVSSLYQENGTLTSRCTNQLV